LHETGLELALTRQYNNNAHCAAGLEAARVLSTGGWVGRCAMAMVHKHKVVCRRERVAGIIGMWRLPREE